MNSVSQHSTLEEYISQRHTMLSIDNKGSKKRTVLMSVPFHKIFKSLSFVGEKYGSNSSSVSLEIFPYVNKTLAVMAIRRILEIGEAKFNLRSAKIKKKLTVRSSVSNGKKKMISSIVVKHVVFKFYHTDPTKKKTDVNFILFLQKNIMGKMMKDFFDKKGSLYRQFTNFTQSDQ